MLPLRTSSADAGNLAFCQGLTEALALRLGQAGDQGRLEVVAPSEVRFESVQNVGQARKKFGANRVLEGTVTEAGSQSRVIYSVVDATTGLALGGDTITAGSADRLSIEDRLVTSVAAFLAGPAQPEAVRATETDRHSAITNHARLVSGETAQATPPNPTLVYN